VAREGVQVQGTVDTGHAVRLHSFPLAQPSH
jgi:hypothetical protein